MKILSCAGSVARGAFQHAVQPAFHSYRSHACIFARISFVACVIGPRKGTDRTFAEIRKTVSGKHVFVDENDYSKLDK